MPIHSAIEGTVLKGLSVHPCTIEYAHSTIYHVDYHTIRTLTRNVAGIFAIDTCAPTPFNAVYMFPTPVGTYVGFACRTTDIMIL